MNKTGPESANLSARLRETATRQRQEYEKAMHNELATLTRNLSETSSAALTGFAKDTLTELEAMKAELRIRRNAMASEMNELRDSPLRIILITATLTALINGLIWTAPDLVMRWRLASPGLAISNNGTFLILPETAQPGWTCGEKPCVRLGD